MVGASVTRNVDGAGGTDAKLPDLVARYGRRNVALTVQPLHELDAYVRLPTGPHIDVGTGLTLSFASAGPYARVGKSFGPLDTYLGAQYVYYFEDVWNSGDENHGEHVPYHLLRGTAGAAVSYRGWYGDLHFDYVRGSDDVCPSLFGPTCGALPGTAGGVNAGVVLGHRFGAAN